MRFLWIFFLAISYINVFGQTKFEALDNSLLKYVDDSKSKSNAKLNQINQKSGNDDLKTVARLLHASSQKTIDYIENIKKEIIENSGGINENGNYKGMKNSAVIDDYFLGASSTGTAKGKQLIDSLDAHYEILEKVVQVVYYQTKNYIREDRLSTSMPAYPNDAIYQPADNRIVFAIDTINSEMKDGTSYKIFKYLPFTLDGKSDPLLKDFEGNKNKNWLQLTFQHTPLIAVLAFLTEKQSKIAAYEGEMLAMISNYIKGE